MSEINSATSVYRAFAASAARFPQRPFLCVPSTVAEHYRIEAGEICYADLEATVDQLKHAYAAAGYGGGHRIGLMLDNRPAFVSHWFALNALGASVVPINAELSAREQAYLLELSEAVLLLHCAEHNQTAAAAVAALAQPLHCLAFESMAQLPPAPTAATSASINATSECAVLFTSGSTGEPKACLLSNEYFLEMGKWYRDLGGLCRLSEGSERLITPLPLTHMNAMATSLMAMLVTGGCLIQLDRFHPGSWWQTVRETQPTVIHYLGVMPAILLQLPNLDIERNPSIKFGFGAGVNVAHHEVFETRFGFPLIEAWAMTETGAGGCIAANREPRHVGNACFGKPDPKRIEYRLVDENGRDAPVGIPGELLVRAVGEDPRKGFFSGYYRNETASEEAWAGGWWHTGDVVCQLDDGTLCFVDRSKNIIRRSGENIAALEVEAVLSRHDAPRLLAVAPVPDEIRGEEVMALIGLNEGIAASDALASDLFDHCMEALAYFKVPGYVVFVDSLPLTATQKPKRNEIKQLAKLVLSEDPPRNNLFDLRGRKRKQKVPS